MSTLTEDILLAYPPVGSSKLDRLMRLPEHVDIKVGLDSVEVMLDLAASAAASAARGRLSAFGVIPEGTIGLGNLAQGMMHGRGV